MQQRKLTRSQALQYIKSAHVKVLRAKKIIDVSREQIAIVHKFYEDPEDDGLELYIRCFVRYLDELRKELDRWCSYFISLENEFYDLPLDDD